MSKTIGDFPDYTDTIDPTDRLYLFKKALVGSDRDQALYSAILAQLHNFGAGTWAANQIAYSSASNVLSLTALTALARTLLAAPDTPTAQAALGVAITPHVQTGANVDACSTAFLGSATYNNGTAGVGATLTAVANGAIGNIDGVSMSVGKRVLYKNSGTVIHNGIYTVTQVGDTGTPWIMTRATDCDSPAEIGGIIVRVGGGSTLNNNQYYCPLAPGQIVIGTTLLPFSLCN